MVAHPSQQSVNIRPGVGVLSVLRHLNYRAWFALSEFVDNSIQSYLDNQGRLSGLPDWPGELRVRVNLSSPDDKRITIIDNAAGIAASEFPRAFRPAELPPDTTGLSEFGMGMKSAACWFAPWWRVRTSALGEPSVKTVTFDVNSIVNDEVEELDVATESADESLHFTEIELRDVYRPPVARTIAKIKEHLSEIYREFTRDGTLSLTINGESQQYNEPPILVASDYRDPNSAPMTWRKEIDLDFGEGQHVSGFAALRDPGSTSHAGFALFRKRRVIQGSADEKYRPKRIFGGPNKWAYQRLFGELHLTGIEVSHTKDGFVWQDNEDVFLDLLYEHLDGEDLPLLKQARGYRSRNKANAATYEQMAAQAFADSVTSVQEALSYALNSETKDARSNDQQGYSEPPEELPEVQESQTESFELEHEGVKWTVQLECTTDSDPHDWLEVSQAPRRDSEDGTPNQPRKIALRLSLMHPFMQAFLPAGADGLAPFLRLAAGIGLAEVLARESGARYAGTVRRYLNDLLRDGLSEV